MQPTANGPEDETRFDTVRLQRALDECPAGQAVELEPDGARGAFLIAPVEVPAGVTLLVDAGVTVYGSRWAANYRATGAADLTGLPCGDRPCRALIHVSGGTGGRSGGVAGFGTLDGRGAETLLEVAGAVRWTEVAEAARPDLIDSQGNFALNSLTLHSAAGVAVRLEGNGQAVIAGAKIIARQSSETPSVNITSAGMRVLFHNSTFSGIRDPLADADHVHVCMQCMDGSADSTDYVSAHGAAGQCLPRPQSEMVCTPAILPLFVGEIFLSSGNRSNLAEAKPAAGLKLHAVVTSTGAGVAVASGAITFFDGEHAIGTAELRDGLATLDVPALDRRRKHILTARDSYGAVAFGMARALLQAAATSVALSSDATQAVYGTPVNLTASVTPAAATGTISFYDGATLLGSASLTAGSASLSETQLAPGSHTLTAHYDGDLADAPGDSPDLTLSIEQARSTIMFNDVPATAAYGTLQRVSAALAPAPAAGSATLLDSFSANGQTQNVTLSSAAVDAGAVTWSLPVLAVGRHVLTAAYGGDTNDLASTSAPATVTISALNTAVTLSSSRTTLVYGTTSAFSASLSPPDATGSVTFQDSQAGVLGQVSVAQGMAALNVASLLPGFHSVFAAYSGDATHQPSVSPAIAVNVSRAASTVALAALPASVIAGTPLMLAASLLPASASGVVTFSTTSGTTLGQAQITAGRAATTVTFLPPGSYGIVATYAGDSLYAPASSAVANTRVDAVTSGITLTAAGGALAYGQPLLLSAAVAPASATGEIAFSDASLGALGTSPLRNGLAQFATATLSAGTHTLQAAYAGDSNNAARVSSPLAVAIAQASTATTLSVAQSTVPAGLPVAFNVKVTTQAGSIPTGVVEIHAGSRLLAAGAITNAVPGAGFVTLAMSSATLGAGTFSAAAVYRGDGNHAASSSASATEFTVVGIPTTTTLSVSSNQVALSAAVKVQVSVLAVGQTAKPAGSVSFLEDGVVFASSPVNGAGIATALLPDARLGSHAITAVYKASGLFAGSASTAEPLRVTLPLALALAPVAISARANFMGSATLTITPLSGFNGPIDLTCSSPASFITCTVLGPASVDQTPVQAAVQIKVARDLAQQATVDGDRTHELPFVLASLLPLCLLGRRRSRPRVLLFTLLSAILLSGMLSGCALGGNFFNIPAGPQSVVVKVSAAGINQQTQMTVNIAP